MIQPEIRHEIPHEIPHEAPYAIATVAQSSDPGEVFSEILPWLLILLGVVIVGAILVYLLRPSARDGGDGSAPGFTLQDLREMHAAGDLSDDEFERAKAAMIERVSAATSENSEDSADAEDDADERPNE